MSPRLHYAECHFAPQSNLDWRQSCVNQPFVFSMIPKPKPEQTVLDFYSQSAVLTANTTGPKSANFFKMQRRMCWVCSK